MYLEFLPDELLPDYPLLIFFTRPCQRMLNSYTKRCAISLQFLGQWWIFTLCPLSLPVDGCRLSAQVIDEDIGVVLIKNTQNHFTWKLTREVWKDVLNLLYPFTPSRLSRWHVFT